MNDGLSRRELLARLAAGGALAAAGPFTAAGVLAAVEPFAAAGTLAAAGPPATAAPLQTPRRGGRIRVAGMASSAADTLDPAKGSLSTDYVRHYMLYSG
ncbi:MAG: hypothetical protein IT481_00375, partial [Gammaproteobacteria bacterium]|nr:hypothetical protein [Gammaproteobacteria bacterium]